MSSLNREFWLLPIFAGISLAYAAWSKEPILWFLFYLCLGCTLLALVYKARNWKNVTVTRTFRSPDNILEAGSDLRVVLYARVHGILPWPWLELSDNLPRTLGKHLLGKPGGHLAWAGRHSMQYVPYTLKNLPRGIHSWGSVAISSGDPLGLVSFRNQLELPGKLVVYPRTVDIQAMNFFPRRVEGAASARKPINQETAQLVGIRDYQPGDRLSLIHWKSTAKTGELQTKEFDPLLRNSSLLILDCSADAWAPYEESAFEEAVIVTASLAKAALFQRIPLRFHTNSGRKLEELSISSQAEYFKLLLRLAGIAPMVRNLPSHSMYRELFIRDSNVVLVTSGRGEEVKYILRRLAARGNAVTVIQIDPAQAMEIIAPRPGSGLKVFRIREAADLSPEQGKRDVN